MWIIFHERKSMFTHIDKNVFALVEDKDIDAFQQNLVAKTGETGYPVIDFCEHLQNFVGNEYFAKRYTPMRPDANRIVQSEPPKLEIATASLFRDAEQRNPYSSGR
jgi:hypothetical protein